MLGQCISLEQFNVVILGAGLGTRMGSMSMHIPKLLTPLGNLRAVDWIIERHRLIADNIVISLGSHLDLAHNYIRGRYPNDYITYSLQHEILTPHRSLCLALDKVDSRLPTLITFCDLLLIDNVKIQPDTLFGVNSSTVGSIGTFRHTLSSPNNIHEHKTPVQVASLPVSSYGLLGYFTFSDTPLLKSIAYSGYNKGVDITNEIVKPYSKLKPLRLEHCDSIIEFGDETTLELARKAWERI